MTTLFMFVKGRHASVAPDSRCANARLVVTKLVHTTSSFLSSLSARTPASRARAAPFGTVPDATVTIASFRASRLFNFRPCFSFNVGLFCSFFSMSMMTKSGTHARLLQVPRTPTGPALRNRETQRGEMPSVLSKKSRIAR